jgi:hypothetical protein
MVKFTAVISGHVTNPILWTTVMGKWFNQSDMLLTAVEIYRDSSKGLDKDTSHLNWTLSKAYFQIRKWQMLPRLIKDK